VPTRLACLTLDVEPDTPNGAGIRLFEEPEKFAWFRDTLRGTGAPLTAFIVMQHGERHAPSLERLASSVPVELAVHSYSHNRACTASPDEVCRARDSFASLWGYAPSGYRAPYGLIDNKGLCTLMREGFHYDSSVFPTLRVDEFGYNNLRYPIAPFVFTDGQRDLVEIPVAALRCCRLVYSLSFVKLLGPSTFRHLTRFFPLPDIVVVDLHPYDFYADQIAGSLRSWKRYAHLRNAQRAPALFEEMLEALRSDGYSFTSMDQVARIAAARGVTRITLPT